MRLLPKLAVISLAACATTRPVPNFEELLGEPPQFRALYRLECCGVRGLLLVVAHGAGGTSLEVAGGPAGVGVAVWAEGDTVLWRTARGCLEGGHRGALPLPGGAVFPFPEKVLAGLLAGRLPTPGSSLTPHRWVSQLAGGTLELEVVGAPTRWVVGRWTAGGQGGEVFLRARRHHGRVPGEIAVRGAGFEGTLRLLEFQPVPFVAPPPWLELPRCGE